VRNEEPSTDTGGFLNSPLYLLVFSLDLQGGTQLTNIKALGKAAVACESMCNAAASFCWKECFQNVDFQAEHVQGPAKMA
jgi:hypothetical protein